MRSRRKESQRKKFEPDPMIKHEEAHKQNMKKAGKRPQNPTQQHHHADIKKARQVQASPDMVGQNQRMSSVWTGNKGDKSVSFGTVGQSPFVGQPERPHDVAEIIDFDEQARVPETPQGLKDASDTSKWRWPDTNDMSERGQYDWTRKVPKGPAVDPKTGVVIKKSVAKTVGKKVLKAFPIVGALVTLFEPGEASASERVLRAVAGEIAIGPIDLELVYDFAANLDTILGTLTGQSEELEKLDELNGGRTNVRGNPTFNKPAETETKPSVELELREEYPPAEEVGSTLPSGGIRFGIENGRFRFGL